MFFAVLAVFTVDNSPRYYVAYTNEDGQECYGNSYDNEADALAFAEAVGREVYVVLRAPLDF